jgi:hypothetical protein
MARRHLHLSLICVLALACLTAFSGCGKVSNKPGETVIEGLSTPLGGLRYTVFLTRMLNLKNEEDSGYLPTHKEAPPGRGLYAVFMEACDKGKSPANVATQFYMEDSQGNRFQPETLPKSNPFAFQPGIRVQPDNCEPLHGSLAQQGPTSGAVLLFNLPLATTENRPLTLHIVNPAGTSPAEATVTLDI